MSDCLVYNLVRVGWNWFSCARTVNGFGGCQWICCPFQHLQLRCVLAATHNTPSNLLGGCGFELRPDGGRHSHHISQAAPLVPDGACETREAAEEESVLRRLHFEGIELTQTHPTRQAQAVVPWEQQSIPAARCALLWPPCHEACRNVAIDCEVQKSVCFQGMSIRR